MAYGYLLAPSFQFVNINGRPLVGGHIEVFIHNTDTKYITKADFDGTDNPFKVPLNSKGMAVIIASGDFTYDVFCYDRFGSLFWSGSDVAIDNSSGLVIEGAELPMRIVGGKITNNGKELACTGENAWAEGAETTASGANAHAEGGRTTASGEHSHSEGFRTNASSGYSHAEGAGSKATNSASHAEGQDTTASGQASHAEGRGSEASGNYSHASGRGTRATGESSTAVGKYNDDGDALFVVGNGIDSDNRKDVFKVDRNGDTLVSINGVLTKVTNLSGDQFVLVRSNMTTDFTNAEYKDCVDAVTAEKAVCCQFVQTGTTMQAQLTMITGSGTLVFEFTAENYHYRWEVAATSNAHSIELIGKIFGVPIFDTLQDAITNEYTLKSGDIFETNGFHTSGDGGAARYRVSSTGTANGIDTIQLATGKLAILQTDEVSIPEQYGAYGDGSTDDTYVFDYLFTTATIKTIQLSANKTYKIQFKNWTFSNKTVIGTNKDSSILTQASANLNTPLFTLGTNCDIGNMTIICGGGNNIRTGLFHFGNNKDGVFTPFIGTRIHDIHAYCVDKIIGVDISYSQSGSYNLKLEHCKFDSPGVGVRISNLGDTTHQSYISDFYFEDILVSGPYSYGLEIDKALTGGMMVSHGLLSQFSAQLQRDGSCGFKLTHGDITLINPTAFIENSTGTVYSIELDFNKINPSNLTNGIISCYGGILEGIIKSKEYLDKVSWKNTDFVEEAKFSDNTSGIRPTSRHLSTTPVSIYHKTAEQTYSSASVTNGTKALVDDKYGQVIEVAVSDFSKDYTEINIPVALPSENFITMEVLLLYTNAFKINDTSGNKFPCLILTDSNGNDIYDVSGISQLGRYGRVTMDMYQTYYGLNACFDITGLDRTSTWKLKVKIPTEYSTAVENAKFQVLGLNVYLQYATLPDLRIETIRNEEWYNREPIDVVSQNTVAGTGGQWLTFTFTQIKFTRLVFITFTVKNLVLTADEDLTVDIMSGSTVLRSYTMSLKAGTHSFEVSISSGGTSYTPKLVLTSSNHLISGGTYTCYIQGVSY